MYLFVRVILILDLEFNREDNKVAMGGGVADAFQAGRSGKFAPTTHQIFGVAVSGPNIMAASLVIPESVDNPRHLGRYMMMVSDSIVSFQLSCSSSCGNYST